MPRITISIPEDLREKLTDPRVRKSINLSRICQKALSREVRRILDLPLDLARMEGMLQRLRSDQEIMEDQWFAKGGQAARDWVENEAPYAWLRRFGQLGPSQRLTMLRRQPPTGLASCLEQIRDLPDFDEGNFLRGWEYTTSLLWELIERNL
jgi:hypothetical protein